MDLTAEKHRVAGLGMSRVDEAQRIEPEVGAHSSPPMDQRRKSLLDGAAHRLSVARSPESRAYFRRRFQADAAPSSSGPAMSSFFI